MMKHVAPILAAAMIGLFTTAVCAHEFKVGSLEIEHPYARTTPPNAPVSGGYMTIVNHGKEADRLISGSADFAKKVEIHEMSMQGNVMKMRKLADGLKIPAGGKVVFKPGGYHLMFVGINSQFKQGETRKVTLNFEKAGPVELEFKVEDMSKMKNTMDMDHSKMKMKDARMKQGG